MQAAWWEVWKMERGRFYQPFGEKSGSGQQDNTVNDIRGLIERRRGLYLPDINEYVMMWKDLAALTIPSGKEPYRIRVSEEEHEKIVQVSRGIDFVLFNE